MGGKGRPSKATKKKLKIDDKKAKKDSLLFESIATGESTDEEDIVSSSDDEPVKKKTKKEMALEKEDELIDKYLKQFKKNNDIPVTDYAKQTTDAIQQINKSITVGFERLIFMNQMMLTRSSNNENFYGGHAQERYSRFGRFSPDRNSRSSRYSPMRSYYSHQFSPEHRSGSSRFEENRYSPDRRSRSSRCEQNGYLPDRLSRSPKTVRTGYSPCEKPTSHQDVSQFFSGDLNTGLSIKSS